MPVEHFEWTPLDYDQLEERLRGFLSTDHQSFQESVPFELPECDDRVEACGYRDTVKARLQRWAQHFELPSDTSIRDWYSVEGIPIQSWSLQIRSDSIAAQFVNSLRAVASGRSRIWRPKVLETANAEIMRAQRNMGRTKWSLTKCGRSSVWPLTTRGRPAGCFSVIMVDSLRRLRACNGWLRPVDPPNTLQSRFV